MALPDEISRLPDVQKGDIDALLADDAAELDDKKEPEPFAKWLIALKKYPVLCREIDNQARTEVLLSSLGTENSEQLAQRFNRFGAHIIELYEYAALREANEAHERAEAIRRTTKLHFSDGDDGVSRPL
jgi:hypothetical protein